MSDGGLLSVLGAAPEEAAPRLLGAHMVSDIDGQTVRARLVEVEAYKGSEDPASHAYRGRTERNASMFERSGTLYVYRSYGIHWCANVSVGLPGVGWAILFRGAEILEGVETARARRGRSAGLADGPGKLCQALGIDGRLDGVNLLDSTSIVRLEPGKGPQVVMATPRVGVSKAADRPWRFIAAAAVTPIG